MWVKANEREVPLPLRVRKSLRRSPRVAMAARIFGSRSMSTSGHSLVAAVEQSSWWPGKRSLMYSSAVAAAYVAHNEAVRAYAYMRLGSAATEQLFMQKLEGTVELELRLRSFESKGELRGLLTPVSRTPHTVGPINHRAFTLLHHAGSDNGEAIKESGLSTRTRDRHEKLRSAELPPVATLRRINLWAPWHLSALVFGPSEMHLYIKKSRSHTEYYTVQGDAGRIWGGGLED